MDKNKFKQLKIELAKDLSARLNISGDKAFNRDLKTVLDCVNLTPQGGIIVDYGYMDDSGLDSEKIMPFIEKFFSNKGLKNTSIKEGEVIGQTKKRYVATIEFYVYSENENYANREVQQIMNMIDEQYDNHPQLVDLVPQQFGKLGIGETKVPGEAGVIGADKVDKFVTEMIKVLKDLRDSAENIDDFIGKTSTRSTEQLLKIMKNPKLKEATIKYMQLEKKLGNLSPENQLAIAAKFAERYYEIFDI